MNTLFGEGRAEQSLECDLPKATYGRPHTVQCNLRMLIDFLQRVHYDWDAALSLNEPAFANDLQVSVSQDDADPLLCTHAGLTPPLHLGRSAKNYDRNT